MNAEITNAITNGLHALFLLVYFAATLRARKRGNEHFTAAVVGFFLLTFVLKVMGVYVHYAQHGFAWAEMWVAISVGLATLHYTILLTLNIPPVHRGMGLLFAVACTVLFLLRRDFTFLAVEIVVFNLAAAFYSRGLLRIGFAGVVGSAVVWIVARKATEAVLGGVLPTVWRYDNDLFHFLLIGSTYLVYKAFARGDGVPAPARAERAVEEAEAA